MKFYRGVFTNRLHSLKGKAFFQTFFLGLLVKSRYPGVETLTDIIYVLFCYAKRVYYPIRGHYD